MIMNSDSIRGAIDNTRMPTCTLPGHQLKQLVYVCLNSTCAKCQARGSRLLCTKCMLTESHTLDTEEIKDFIMSNSQDKLIVSAGDSDCQIIDAPTQSDSDGVRSELLNIVEEYTNYLINYRQQCSNIVDT